MTKVALTSYYDKMELINEIDCVPFGYMEKPMILINIL